MTRIGELQTAIRAARIAGAYVRSHFRTSMTYSRKADDSVLTRTDRESERIILRVLRTAFPQYSILSEESGHIGTRDATTQWVVDPLDGTRSFFYGEENFSVGIGLVQNGQCVVGVISIPMRGELFAGARGVPATLNGRPLHRLARPRIPSNPFVTIQGKGPVSRIPHWFRVLRQAGFQVRVGKYAALQAMASLAAGRCDAVLDAGNKPWDRAAGIALVQSLGSHVLTHTGKPITLDAPTLIAGSPPVTKRIIRLLSQQ